MGIKEFESAVPAALPGAVAVVLPTAPDEVELTGWDEIGWTAGDPGHDPGVPHTDAPDFAGLRHRTAKGLTVLARFAGRGLTRDDLNVINAADRANALGGTIVTTPPASRRRNRGRTS